MTTGRGRRITWCSVVGGTLVLLLCGVAFRHVAIEWWWLRRLQSEDTEERKAAAGKLAEMKSARAVPLLVAQLTKNAQDAQKARETSAWQYALPTYTQWASAVRGQGETRWPWRVRWINEAALTDPLDADASWWWSACWVGETLVRIGKRAIPQLHTVLEAHGDEDARYAAVVLARMGREAVPTLESVLQRGRVHARRCSLRALARIGSDARSAGRSVLRAFDDEDPEVRILALYTLCRISPDFGTALGAFVRELSAEQPIVLQGVSKRLQSVPPEIRRPISAILASLRDTARIRTHVLRCSRDLSGPVTYQEFRLAYAEGLCGIGPEAVPALEKLLSDEDREIRKVAAEELSRIRDVTAAGRERSQPSSLSGLLEQVEKLAR